MAKKIWRHVMTAKEQQLWDLENMEGWRRSLVGCVEDDAREDGCKKFVLCDSNETVVAKGDVSPLPDLAETSFVS